MRRAFVESVLRRELAAGGVEPEHAVIAVCAGPADVDVFGAVGMDRVTFTNVDTESAAALYGDEGIAADWKQADAHALPFEDGSFDVAFVSDGLHHCRSPHRAVTEMLRVARLGVIVIESRDSLAMRLARRFGLADEYEFNSRLLETREHGGVDFGPVPNFIYRWTEREFEKLVRTYDPEHDYGFAYYHGATLPDRVPAARLASAAMAAVASRQGNTFAMIAYRRGAKPWLEAGRLRPSVRNGDVQRHRPVQRRRARA